MKIGILTQPLYNNYGGLLQNFALHEILKDLGHTPITINIVHNRNKPLKNLFGLGVRILLRTAGKNIRILPPSQKEIEFISQHTSRFVEENINTTYPIKLKLNQDLLKEYDFNAYIVGSDQVWRPRYSPQLSSFFLDFLYKESRVKKIAYAASFGVSKWEFTKKQTMKFGKLLKYFDAVSVREDSGASLCKKYLDVEATHILDPTMLLNKKTYISIVENKNIKKSSGNLFTYILDRNDDKDQIIDTVSDKYNLNAFSVMPYKSFSESGRRDINDCIFPQVEKWIRGFMDAEFVITDSFHGTVFSILFNKPFIAIANENRGKTRFTSILKQLGIEDRLFNSTEDFIMERLKPIDWNNVNSALSKEKEKSIKFLVNSLG